MTTRGRSFIFLTICLGACSGMHDMGNMDAMNVPPSVIEFPPSEGRFESILAEDENPDPDIVEVTLEAKVAEVEWAPGRRMPMWTYNGILPGPRIEARVGNTVRVRLTNWLPEATTIHWHGLRVPAAMDGSLAVQAPVPPGTTFDYEFMVPDSGTFWYHPHVRSDEQVERGLYGAFIVRGDEEPATNTDRTVLLDDILINSDGALSAFENTQAMLGRQGNVLLTNGRAHPIAPLTPGGLHRFRFINTANARYFRLAVPGNTMIQIGSDGGLLEVPRSVNDVLLVPGERADVLVQAGTGQPTPLVFKTLRYERGHSSGTLPDAVLFQGKITADPPITAPLIPPSFRIIPPLPESSQQRLLKLEESMGSAGEHAGHGGGGMMVPIFSINGQVFPQIIPLAAALDTVEDWAIENTTEMDHPFHLHGFRFQVLLENSRPPSYRAWRDTINIPAKQTTVFRVRLEDHPGSWMFHCHILEHAERGMMGELKVGTAEPNN